MPLAAAPVSGAKAQAIMHERHEGMEAIGKADKALNRELKSASPDLAAVRASRRDDRDLARKASGLVPGRHRPRRRQDQRQARNLANAAGFRRQARKAFQAAAQASTPPPQAAMLNAIKARLRRPRQEPARRATTISRGDASLSGRRIEAAGLGPADPAGPLAAGRPDRVQLVVGREPPHRLAHLVGLSRS